MIAAGQQFAAAVHDDVVHLAFLSADGEWRLACADEAAQLQHQDPVLSCDVCQEIADEEVAGDPPPLAGIADVLALVSVDSHDFGLLATR